ncbi:MAG: DUF2306 domain-containing protein [Phenylobacterium sp.]|uniref:DUF2306 domain-containing protein n=1 Tax=Phenylobacterium sp. TaxID=1871053 RepID=UPI002737351C|nr:DUF2306 domain-containing protein [Phenylobacterium sp.]MDP1641436.1 DUF2306 domain-containing protein [Phenylobacterium sp.]MDP3118011.1 DUF2306 domain-containing protein [Phenylobacterium sp.]
MTFGRGFALSLGVVFLILAGAMWGIWPAIGRELAAARPHAPDFAVLAKLSPVVKIHLYTALAALVLGAVLMTARKGRTFHRTAGWMWVALVMTTAVSTLFITSLNQGRWSLIHLFTGWTLIILPLAVIWAKRRDVARHRRAMMGLFYGAFAVNLIIAFIPGRTMWTLFFG